jgi:hypothetical protein
MDHVSRPMQALLLATVAFAALWFVALRPKAPASSPPQPAAPTHAATPAGHPKSAIPGGLGRAVDKAHAAKTQGDAAAAAASAQTATTAKPAPATAAAPKPTVVASAKPAPAAKPRPARGGPARVQRELARGHVVVLLFYAPGSPDDGLVRGEVSGVSRHGGRVYVKSVRVARLSRYQDVLRGIQVLQTPTVVVLRQGRDPVLMAGYTDRTEVDKAAAALLRRR